MFNPEQNAIVERKKFYEEFGGTIGDTVLNVELAELHADRAVYRELEITPDELRPYTVGLIIFCKNSLHFYIPASENSFSSFVRKAAHKEEAKSQDFNFLNLSNLKFALPRHRTLDFLRPEIKRTVCASFTSKEGSTLYFNLVLNKKALPLLNKLKEFKAK